VKIIINGINFKSIIPLGLKEYIKITTNGIKKEDLIPLFTFEGENIELKI
jgi:hypothetical protein